MSQKYYGLLEKTPQAIKICHERYAQLVLRARFNSPAQHCEEIRFVTKQLFKRVMCRMKRMVEMSGFSKEKTVEG